MHQPIRQKLPRTRRARTFEFRVADCKGFANIGEYADGRPGEIFLTVSKQGSTLSGIMDAFAKSISYGLQYGVPMRAFVEAFTNMRFEPAGMTDDPDIRFASSIMDYLFRRLALEYLTYDERAELGIFSIDERLQPTLPGVEESVDRDPHRQRDRCRPEERPVGRRAGRPARARRRTDGAEQRHHQPRWHRSPGRRCAEGAPERCADVHAVRRADDPRRLVPRLPELRQHQRLQLIRLNTGPNGRRGNGPCSLLSPTGLRQVPSAARATHDTDADGELDFSDFELHQDEHRMDRVANC